PHDGCGGSGACRAGRPRGAAGKPNGRGGEGGGNHRRDVAAVGDAGEGVRQPRVRDEPDRRCAGRAPGGPLAVCHRGPEGGHGGVRGEASAELQGPMTAPDEANEAYLRTQITRTTDALADSRLAAATAGALA